MLVILSPAKTLDFDSPVPPLPLTLPAFLPQSEALVGLLRDLSVQDLATLMDLSDKLAALNVARFAEWSPEFTDANSRAAVLAFRGDVYEGMQAWTFAPGDHAFAQRHLRILSGLYGLLRPLDRLQPYRLEMGTALANPAGRNLYAFWGSQLARALNEALAAQGDDVLVNLASDEYSRAALTPALAARVVTPQFREEKDGRLRMVSFHAKRARGLMAGWIVRERLRDPAALRDFDADGYRYNAALSRDDTLVFTRPMPVARQEAGTA
ncbi:MAG TPA: peroxide stress protein YaaA [Moraxellaceae bacterium]|nr:peroxide stress protein YaaA [Moraxellaceae bacterium]